MLRLFFMGILLLATGEVLAEESLLPDLPLGQEPLLKSSVSGSVDMFIKIILGYRAPLSDAAMHLLWMLAPISLSWRGYKLLLTDGLELVSVLRELVFFCLWLGFAIYLINHGPDIGRSIFNSVIALADSENTGPTEIFDEMFSIYRYIQNEYKLTFDSLVLLFVNQIWFLCMLSALSYFLGVYICAHVICVIGILIMPLSVLEICKNFLLNYAKTVLANALTLMALMILFKGVFTVMSVLGDTIHQPNYFPAMSDVAILSLLALLVCALTVTISRLATGLVSGMIGDVSGLSAAKISSLASWRGK